MKITHLTPILLHAPVTRGGHAEQWFYQHLAGLQIDFSQAPAQQIIIHPDLVGDITWAEAKYQSILGPISCRWERIDQGLRISIQIPPGVIARVYVPTTNPQSVHEVGSHVRFVDQPNIKLVEHDDNYTIFEVPSGTYLLECELHRNVPLPAIEAATK